MRLFITILSLAYALNADGRAFILDESDDTFYITDHLSYLEDENWVFQGLQIIDQAHRFSQRNPQLTYTDSRLWLRVDLINQSSNRDWVIMLDNHLLVEVELIDPFNRSSEKTGTRVPIEDKKFKRGYLVWLHNKSKSWLCRYKGFDT